MLKNKFISNRFAFEKSNASQKYEELFGDDDSLGMSEEQWVEMAENRTEQKQTEEQQKYLKQLEEQTSAFFQTPDETWRLISYDKGLKSF